MNDSYVKCFVLDIVFLEGTSLKMIAFVSDQFWLLSRLLSY